MQTPTDTRGQKIRLTAKARKQLRQWLCDPEVTAKEARRGHIIELLAQGASQHEARKATGAGIATIGRVRRRLSEERLESAVFGYVPSGRSKVLTEDDASRVVAIACSDPPKGRSAWTLQLIAEHAVSTPAVPAIGKQAARLILKSHGLKPWLKKMGCVPNLDRPYVKRMNDVLETYPRPFCSRYPVVCIDEKPTQLLDAYRSGYRTRTAI